MSLAEHVSQRAEKKESSMTQQTQDTTTADLAAGFAAGLDPREVAEAVLSRIAEREPVLNAFYLHDPDQVRADAAASAARWAAGTQRSKYDGVPVTVKENIPRAGHPVPSGTALANPPIAQSNAPVTDRLLEAGMVILGSTTMPDWGMLSSGVSSLHGISRNAWNPALTTGGSSAGAGAAAAAGYGPLHVGTDIGGSIRLPGTWAGLATLKPSAGLVPLHAPYLGRAAGPLSRTVAGAADLMSVIARPDARDYSTRPYPQMDWTKILSSPRGLRVGLQLHAGPGAAVDPEVAAAVQSAAEMFSAAGATVVSVAPFLTQEVLTGIDAFWRTRSWADYKALDEEARGSLLPYIARWCTGGKDYDGAATIQNYQRFGQLQQATREATEGFDLVLSPVAPMAAFGAEDPMPSNDPDTPMTHISFTLPYNMSGQPAATINCGFTSDGRTIGLQVAGRVGADDDVLAACAWYESVRGDAAPDWSRVP
ncbi:amidase [Paeniglutamicibacter gangotriensis]|uniref:Glutamyl-tRNA(Gln) amidotransferase subunit A n=1 Tax=Paeniglutamicibacter gangotriensis Lz1y TaxID=1276920 RepID=M7NKR1_9MICC|nr:amidase [Paeniglutamicibacter gangotriensis]EMQ99143.1 glutamyl-tRNA(Gln) amidotransferase subunit A [Paeniglutamicibacter gangotriensis Lz1y]